MKKYFMLTCYLLFAGLTSVYAATCIETKDKLDPRFAGTWISNDTAAEYNITINGQTLCLAARDSNDNENFEISQLDWNGHQLRATFRMPSSRWTTHSNITLDRSQGTLIDEFSTSQGERFRLILQRSGQTAQNP